MKSGTRQRVWQQLRQVALPDSRYDWDFDNFIADFHGSESATTRLEDLRVYQNSQILFIAPDNCLEYLRWRSLCDGKTILTTTYGIRRGFWILDPKHIQPQDYRYAATLDGMERVAQSVSLMDICSVALEHGNHADSRISREQCESERESESEFEFESLSFPYASSSPRIPLLVTGSGAINRNGVRIGKGHGYFDLEWAMLWSVGAVSQQSVVAAIVHDCQLVDEGVKTEEYDTVCDVVLTPSKTMNVFGMKKPVSGIIWGILQPGMIERIPPLKELSKMRV